MEFLNSAFEFISNNLMASSATVAIVLEFGLRLVKTPKPLSILWLIHDGLALVGKTLSSAATFLDKVLPQRTV